MAGTDLINKKFKKKGKMTKVLSMIEVEKEIEGETKI